MLCKYPGSTGGEEGRWGAALHSYTIRATCLCSCAWVRWGDTIYPNPDPKVRNHPKKGTLGLIITFFLCKTRKGSFTEQRVQIYPLMVPEPYAAPDPLRKFQDESFAFLALSKVCLPSATIDFTGGGLSLLALTGWHPSWGFLMSPSLEAENLKFLLGKNNSGLI